MITNLNFNRINQLPNDPIRLIIGSYDTIGTFESVRTNLHALLFARCLDNLLQATKLDNYLSGITQAISNNDKYD